MPENKIKKFNRTWVGKVVSNKQDKTIVVAINTIKFHPLYKKKFTSTKKFQVHDENNKFQIGDTVEFKEVKPISKLKHWIVIDKPSKIQDTK